MKTTLKVLVVFLALASVITAPLAVNASQLDSALSGMFSNMTGAGVAKTPDRTAFIGGGLTLRGPISNVNIAVFDMPRASAGCGGLDMFGGSFSFINGAQIVALFRKVAANAVGLAFKAAINAINPQLGALMDKFQSMISEMNNAMKNTCSLAGLMMDKSGANKTIADSVKGWTDGLALAINGKAADAAEGAQKVTENAVASANEADKLTIISGNAVWKAINNPNANNGAGLGAFLTDPTSTNALSSIAAKSANEIIMSMTGYYVVKTEDKGTNGAGVQLASSVTVMSPASIEIDELRRGGTLTKFVCLEPYKDDTDGGCLNVTTTEFQFAGMQGYVRDLLLGGDTTSVDIVSAMAAQPPTPFLAQQTLLLQSTELPVMRLMHIVGNNMDGQRAVLTALTPIIAENMLYQYMTAASKVLKLINRNPTAPIPEFVNARIIKLNADTADLAEKQKNWVKELNDITAYALNVRAGSEATFFAMAGAK